MRNCGCRVLNCCARSRRSSRRRAPSWSVICGKTAVDQRSPDRIWGMQAADFRGLASMSFFITLIELTDASRRDFEALPKVHAMVHHGLPLAEYKAFLLDLYHVVWHFCPMMAAAAARCGDEFRGVRYEL